jgi:hypothetical protein
MGAVKRPSQPCLTFPERGGLAPRPRGALTRPEPSPPPLADDCTAVTSDRERPPPDKPSGPGNKSGTTSPAGPPCRDRTAGAAARLPAAAQCHPAGASWPPPVNVGRPAGPRVAPGAEDEPMAVLRAGLPARPGRLRCRRRSGLSGGAPGREPEQAVRHQRPADGHPAHRRLGRRPQGALRRVALLLPRLHLQAPHRRREGRPLLQVEWNSFRSARTTSLTTKVVGLQECGPMHQDRAGGYQQ